MTSGVISVITVEFAGPRGKKCRVNVLTLFHCQVDLFLSIRRLCFREILNVMFLLF